jgi:glycerophosphoryl diester phosphodiesterase
MDIFAHRGVHDTAPENTIPAFERAVSLGADGIEFDVRLTADRVPVVFHDASLERLTSSSGGIGRLSLPQIKAARFAASGGKEAAIPALREVLETFTGRIAMQIELKGTDPGVSILAGEVLQDFRSAWDDMEIISFEPALLSALPAGCRGLKTGLLCPEYAFWMRWNAGMEWMLRRAGRVGARAVHLHASQLSAKTAAAINRRGFETHVWDVNGQKKCSDALAWSIASICTEEVRTAAECIREWEAAGR